MIDPLAIKAKSEETRVSLSRPAQNSLVPPKKEQKKTKKGQKIKKTINPFAPFFGKRAQRKIQITLKKRALLKKTKKNWTKAKSNQSEASLEASLDNSTKHALNENARVFLVEDWKKLDLEEKCSNLQGILVNLDLLNIERDLQALESINISKEVMTNGLLFIWSTPFYFSKTIAILKEKNFFYVENLSIIFFDLPKILKIPVNSPSAVFSENFSLPEGNKINDFFHKSNSNIETQNQGPNEKKKTNPAQLPKNSEKKPNFPQNFSSNLLQNSKINLLIFKRRLNPNSHIEMRHQRSIDVVSSFFAENQFNCIEKEAMEEVYLMIETMLPKGKGTSENESKLARLMGPAEERSGWKVFTAKE